MNEKRQKKRRKRRRFRIKSQHLSKSAVGQPQAMELIDEIHSSAEEEEKEKENGAEEVVFVCTSTASETEDEADEIEQQRQRQQQTMELVDEIHSSAEELGEEEEEEVIFMCTSTASEEKEETQQQKKKERKEIASAHCENGGALVKCEAAEEQPKEQRIYLPMCQKYLPTFPLLDCADFDGAFDGPPTEVAKLSAEFARQNLSPSERAKAILRLFSDFPSDPTDPRDEFEEEEKPTICHQFVCPMLSPGEIVDDDSENEIEYIGTVKR
ncbi:hypothetical protein niasHS_017820 [Heterodera schachtii]|uniref:Uncharacterized protein n=1 Tax=Heterodera schachtii TaxID=97005 RepID=A0ABD2I0R9_HETSC